MKISQRKSGVIISYISEGVQIVSNLIYTPVMIRVLGQNEYGLYQLAFSFVSYLSLLSMGFGTSYIRFYSRYKVNNATEDINKLNGLFLIVFSVISAICLGCGVVMVSNIKAIFGTSLTDYELSTAKVLMIFMIANVMMTFMSAIFNCITSAHEQFFFQKGVILLQNIANPFLTLPLLFLGYGSVGMVLITTLLTTMRFIINVWFCLKKLNTKFSFKGIKFGLLKEMWSFTFFIFINQIIDQVNWSVDKFLLGRFSGTAAVAVYGLGAQLNSMYLQFSQAISNVFIPKINRLVVENNNDEITSLFARVGRVQFIVLALVLSGFTFFGQQFVVFWGGVDYAESYYVALWLLISVTIPLIQNLGIEIQRAKNKHKTRSLVYLAIAIGNVSLSIYLIRILGVIGAAIGTAISLTIGNVIFMNWYYNRHIGINIAYFWKEIFKLIPALSPSLLVGFIMVKLFNLSNFAVFVACILVYMIIYCASMWVLGMNSYEKGLIVPVLKKLYLCRKKD